MTHWANDELKKISETDDLHISPFREDGVTYGTPTWIWSVVVDNELFVRAYNGQDSSWYRAAVNQKAGCITVAGMIMEVVFEKADADTKLNDFIDEGYRKKYGKSLYLSSMISSRARSSTIKSRKIKNFLREYKINKGEIVMILEEKYTLFNGIEIPKLGLGTWFISDKDIAQAVKDAAKIGYRHIDTAQAYHNERGVGDGIRACGVKREDMFVTTKLAAEVKSYKEAVASINESLKTLGLDYIDMMIIHSPKPWMEFHGNDPYFEGNREAWRALEEAYKAGKLRAIGLSNFKKSDIDNILESCSVKPMVNQILVHISNTPKELIQYNQEKNILVEAYSPIAHGELLKNQEVTNIAEKYGVSVPQLSIRYDLQLGLLPLPKTANPAHMKTNADVDFVISEEDIEFLKNVEPIKDYGNASNMPVFGGKLKQ